MLLAESRGGRARWILTVFALVAMGCSSGGSTAVIDPPENTGGTGGTGGTGTGAVTSVVVTPATELVDVGATKTFTATALNAQGQTVTGHAVAWSVSNTSRASITSTGAVKGLTEGDVKVTATIDGKIGTADLKVEGPPEVEG